LPRLHRRNLNIPVPILESSATPESLKNNTRKSRGHAELHSAPQPSPMRTPLSPDLVLCVRDRPRRQKLLHNRRITSVRSEMQRRTSILRRAAELRQAPPLSSAQVRSLAPAPANLVIPPPEGRNRRKAHMTGPTKTRRHLVLISASNTLYTAGQAFRSHTSKRRHCTPITLHSRTSSSAGALNRWLQLRPARHSSRRDQFPYES